MVLLCALPTLLSMPMHAALPTSFALPHTALPAPTFDFSSFLPADYDWARDPEPFLAPPPASKLEFANTDALAGLDISFDAQPADDGKIRVRIHAPSSASSSRAASPFPSDTFDDPELPSFPSSSSMFPSAGSPPAAPSLSYSPATSFSSAFSSAVAMSTPPSPGPHDPFLGVGDYPMDMAPYAHDVSDMFAGDDGFMDAACGSEYSEPGMTGGKRRVRIALKSLPADGGEGGEWEVSFC